MSQSGMVSASSIPLHAAAPERLAGPEGFAHALWQDYTGYVVSLGLLSLGNLLLLPLITACLSPAEIGLYSLVETAQLQAGTFSLLGMKFAYLYYYAQRSPEDRPRLLGNALALVIAASLLSSSLLALLFASPKFMALFDATPLPMSWLLVPIAVSGGIQTVLLTELRASRHVRLMGIITVAQLALWLLFGIWLVAVKGYGLPGLLGAQATAVLLSSLTAYFLVRSRLVFHISREESLRLLRYGTPLMLGLILRYSLDTICRFALAALVSIEAAGMFLVINRISLLFESLLALPFLTAWGGLVHHALRRPEAEEIVSRISSLALAAASLLALLMLMAQPMLFDLLAHDPMPQAAGVFALLLLSRVVLLVKSPLTAGILRSGHTGWSVSNNLLSLALFLLLLWPATRMGLTGVAGAALIANLLPSATLGIAAWRDCPQRILHPAQALTVLLILGSGLLVMIGPLPSWLCIPLAVAAGLLVVPFLRHASVTNRL